LSAIEELKSGVLKKLRVRIKSEEIGMIKPPEY
jgi:hypothetical protein